MLDGASRIGEAVSAVVADGQPGIGITDHGNMYGALPMYTAARDAGITPVPVSYTHLTLPTILRV